MIRSNAVIVQDMWASGRVLFIEGVVSGDGRVVQFGRPKKEVGIASADELNPESTDVASLLASGAAWESIEEACSLEMEDENLRLSSGKGVGEEAGYVAAEEFPSRQLLWVAHFSFSRPFITVKFGDDALIADSADYKVWKFPIRKPEAFSVGPSEESPETPESEAEALFRQRYPILYDFMETTLWPDVDSFNPIELLHQIVYYSPLERANGLVEELRALQGDEEIGNVDISVFFNKAGAGHPYEVVNPDNAKDFCFSMSESLRFILSLRTNAK